jgi:hypothetical protein
MNKFFQYLNFFPMPLWAAMMFFPHHPLTRRASRSSVVFALAALHYVATLGMAVQQSRKTDTAIDFRSLEGVRAGLATPAGTLAAWAHMLALDLFTGAWIYRECLRLQAPARVRIPALFFTLMTGPFGLLIFLVWRILGAGQPAALSADDG